MSKKLTMQVLVATMNADSLILANKMSLECDAIIANQCGSNSVDNLYFKGYVIKFISSQTKGVGVNRNIALHWADADILLFADDDVTYNKEYSEAIICAFQKFQDADAIIFSMNLTKKGEVFSSILNKDGRLSFFDCLKYGTYVIAVKSSFVRRKNIHFTELFGGGCKYGCGEDSLFLLDMFRNKAKVYTSSYVLGKCAKDQSTWFNGYTDKYFFDRGAWLNCAFPKYKWILKWYYALRLSKKSGVKYLKVLKLLNMGIEGFEKLESFDEYVRHLDL